MLLFNENKHPMEQVVKIVIEQTNESQRNFLENIDKPVLLYRFKTIAELDNFIFRTNYVKDVELKIIIKRREFAEISNLTYEDGRYLFEFDYESECKIKYKGYDIIIL